MVGALYWTLADVAKRTPQHGIGWAIRKVRKAQQRTLVDLALAIGTDAGNLSRVERGSQDITQEALRAAAGELHVSVSDLWKLAEGEDTAASGRVLALTGQLHPDQIQRLLEYGEFLLDRQTD